MRTSTPRAHPRKAAADHLVLVLLGFSLFSGGALGCASTKSPYADLEPCGAYVPGPRPAEQELSAGDHTEPRLIGSVADLRDRVDLDTRIRTGGVELFSEAEFLVDVNGCVREIKVTRNDLQEITDAFVRGLATSRFHPATLNGVPVEVVSSRAWSWKSSL
ncbi:MAG: hypothetical protein JJ896_01170 [Rhodothermales bacterium]|nr:hypothetical protein [Rhodothermales bacterium]MBO6778239.1 hypothetical protein [Rhodothermales bacterium]